jgi:hypothetical protein
MLSVFILYALIVGSIVYAMLCKIHPEVSSALIIKSRFQSNSGEFDWVDLKNIYPQVLTKD